MDCLYDEWRVYTPFSFSFSFLCAKICICFLNFGSDSILIHEIYFYFSYNPLKIYIRDMLFFDKKKKTYIKRLGQMRPDNFHVLHLEDSLKKTKKGGGGEHEHDENHKPQ